jgi:dienelactone hydrolase
VALAACRSVSAAAGPPPDAASDRADVIEAALENGWIRVTLLVPRGRSGPLPVVINPIVPDALLLDRGVAIARCQTNWSALVPLRPPTPAPPPPGPQMRVGAWLLTAPRPGVVGRAFFTIITLEAERSIPKMIDYLRSLPQLDPDRISIAGSSTSGFMALQAMAADPRISLGVVRVACGDYHTFLRLSNLGLAGDPRWLVDGEMVLDPDYEAEIRRIEPIRRADRFPPRPLLLVTGAADQAIPAECAHRTADRLASAYSAAGMADHFRFVELEGHGHDLGAESADLAFEWWERWLF